MNFRSRPLIDPQQRALAAAAGLVGRPRLHAGLALLTLACGPLPDEVGDTELTTGSSTLAPTTEAASSTGSDAPTSSSTNDAGEGTTLVTDASTTLATSDAGSSTTGVPDTTGDGSTTGDTSTGDTSTDGASTGDASTGDGLDDCIDPRTQEVDWVCCEAQNWQPSPQCTPWGPPAPPVAAGRLQRARAARRALA